MHSTEIPIAPKSSVKKNMVFFGNDRVHIVQGARTSVFLKEKNVKREFYEYWTLFLFFNRESNWIHKYAMTESKSAKRLSVYHLSALLLGISGIRITWINKYFAGAEFVIKRDINVSWASAVISFIIWLMHHQDEFEYLWRQTCWLERRNSLFLVHETHILHFSVLLLAILQNHKNSFISWCYATYSTRTSSGRLWLCIWCLLVRKWILIR